jgi:lipoprotein-releasing system ATP-binding protein
MSSGDFLIRAEGVHKIFKKGRNEIPVVRGVDFSIAPGETIAIVGASGVGKSTLLHLMGTLEPPTRGRILYRSEGREVDLSRLGERELAAFRNRALGFVFQFHYLLPEFSALENVMMPALIAGHARGPAEHQARELLKFVGLEHRLEHRPSELSGGEQQRVAVARAVILRPKLLLADELTGNLDSENGMRVMDLLAQLNVATGISICLVTHDLGIAQKMRRVITMKDGQII